MSEITDRLENALNAGSANGAKEFLIPIEVMESIVGTLKKYEEKLEFFNRVVRSN